MGATDPEQIHRDFESRFNEGDIDGLLALYEPDATLIPSPGAAATGPDEIREALNGFLALQGQISLDTKLSVTVGDLAYLSNTWSLEGKDADGNPVSLGATTAEVARRQDDGRWLYVIDNAWGDAAATTTTTTQG
jgi:ketosteroid isomerase-like protein